MKRQRRGRIKGAFIYSSFKSSAKEMFIITAMKGGGGGVIQKVHSKVN